jgi:hypothetical protein
LKITIEIVDFPKKLLNITIEIVDFPIKNGDFLIFHRFLYVYHISGIYVTQDVRDGSTSINKIPHLRWEIHPHIAARKLAAYHGL